MSRATPPLGHASRQRRRGLSLAATGALAAAAISWATFPASGGAGGTRIMLVIAIAAGALSVAQLALAGTLRRQPDSFSMANRIAQQLTNLVGGLPWAELTTVAAIVLEALHKSRPWHTAVLAAALIAYLLAVHLTESEANAAGTLRALAPLLCAGLGLTALSVGAAALPGLPAGLVATLIRVGAVVLAIVVAGVAVPVWLDRGRR